MLVHLALTGPSAYHRVWANLSWLCSTVSAARELILLLPSHQDSGTAAKLTTMLLAMADVRAVLVVLASRLQRLRSAAAKVHITALLWAAGFSSLSAAEDHSPAEVPGRSL